MMTDDSTSGLSGAVNQSSPPMSKGKLSGAALSFADTLPVHFRRACSAVSGDGGLKPWLDAKFGAGKWALADYPRGDVEVALSNHAYADLCVEYGYQRLSGIFASLDPASAAITPAGRAALPTHGTPALSTEGGAK